MFDQYAQQLQNTDPEVRRKAIIALGNSGDIRWLAPLSDVYKNDPDPALRELALKAGRYIKTKSTQFPTPSESAPAPAAKKSTAPFITTPEILEPQETAAPQRPLPAITPLPAIAPLPGAEEIIKPKVKVPTDRERAMAKTRLDTAIGYLSSAQHDKAMTELISAVRYDPDILNNSLARNLAVNLTGLNNVEEALKHVRDRAEFPNPGKGNIAIPGQAPKAAAPLKFDAEMIEALLMVVILFVVLCFANIAVATFYRSLIDMIPTSSLSNPKTAEDVNALHEIINQIGPKEILFGGILGTVQTLMSIGLLYIVGIFLGGAGDLFKFFSALIRIQLIQWILLAAALGVMMFGLYKDLPPRTLSVLLLVSGGLAGLVLIIGYFWMVYAVGKRHEVGFWKGFFIVLVTGIVANVLSRILGAFNTIGTALSR